jgi:hypothetical protein
MRYLLLVASCLLILGNGSISNAMGNKPPVQEKPKYKLEILKMEIVPAPSAVSTTTTLKPKSSAGKNGR